ncbi:SRPBCC family protein [Anaerophaga thermohalophila]|uniref:SRPBCC family protein n=1 Tax=Anaerophaga thermohalophila TaxID=177400 RepID=UPI0002E2BD2C|nr:SRPBCC family protein [Anaerophaga thermohalophila]
MTRFESDIKTVPYSAAKIYEVLSDFDNFESLLPSDKIQNWQSFGDSCRFEVTGVGPIKLKIIDKEPEKTIKYTADGTVPFNFFLWVQLKQDEAFSKVKVTLDADLNPMMKMVARGPLEQFVGLLADAIASHSY